MRACIALAVTLALAGPSVALAAEQKSGLPQLNAQDFAPQLIWLAITFVLLYLVLSRLALPRIGEVIEERRDRITRDLEAAERLKVDTEKALCAYEKAIADARASASGLARQTREALNAEVEKERGKLERQIGAKVGEAEARIAASKSQALASVTEIAADTVATIVSKLIGQDVSRDEINRALGAGSSGGKGGVR